jgi:CRP-like cAMP-binding protein
LPRCGPGSWFGELAFVTGLPRPFEMEAASASRLLRFGRQDVDRIATARPEIWFEIARLAALNEAQAIGSADDLMLRDTRKRLAALLLRLAAQRNAFQGTTPIDVIPATQGEIADACGLSRSVAASAMAAFVASGAIRTEYGRVRILQPEILERMLQQDAYALARRRMSFSRDGAVRHPGSLLRASLAPDLGTWSNRDGLAVPRDRS